MELLDRDVIIEAIRTATQEVFFTMLGMEMEPGDAHVETTESDPAEGVMSLIGLAGDWAGTGSVGCSAAFACKISSQLLMTELSGVDGEVLDAIAEITNMIIGNVKTNLEDRLGPMGLSIPTVVFGKNFTMKSVGSNEWIVVPFLYGKEQMDVKICLSPNRKRARKSVRPGYNQYYSVRE
jgi:chemotaxis protein CheX